MLFNHDDGSREEWLEKEKKLRQNIIVAIVVLLILSVIIVLDLIFWNTVIASVISTIGSIVTIFESIIKYKFKK